MDISYISIYKSQMYIVYFHHKTSYYLIIYLFIWLFVNCLPPSACKQTEDLVCLVRIVPPTHKRMSGTEKVFNQRLLNKRVYFRERTISHGGFTCFLQSLLVYRNKAI